MESSRPASPESLLANSFHHANSTIDDLTLALANFSRVPSPEPPTLLTCCCGGGDCENVGVWLDLKTRLESRLILSAGKFPPNAFCAELTVPEVGQALLEKHEAYVRRHEPPQESHGDEESVPDHSALQMSELFREKAKLEKVGHILALIHQILLNAITLQRLNQALVNNEVTEVSTKTILHELQEARATISRLTAQHARSVGWENRLSTAMRERDDMQQERDGESNRAKLAETRFAAMKDKAAKLQSDVRRLQDTLEERRHHRLEFSDNILKDARSRLEAIHSSLGQTAMIEPTELTRVLESLVNDNETLKRDNLELQTMLTDSREEINALQGEVDEHRAKPPSRHGASTPQLRHQIFTGSVPGSLGKDHSEPLTPETNRRPLSPADSLTPSEARFTPLSQPQPRYAPPHVSIDVDDSFLDDPSSPEKPKTHKTILLLTRSRAVQTDPWPSPLPVPSYLSSSPRDPRSESSSFSDTLHSHLSVLLDRFYGLQNRLSQADALTLTNRLKRQHLRGADVGYLSRSTVNNILLEATNLRSQFRFLLEDDSVVTPCTRKDFRILFKLFKEIFAEMGELRVVLNDVILDPSCAPRISELALNPSKVEEERKEKERESAGNSATSGWMAPISKLFSPTGRGESSGERSGLLRSVSGRGTRRPHFIPKLGPALSASTTTVNVEFSGTAVGRSTTSTVTSQVKTVEEEASGSSTPSTGVMNIFAGAPRNATPDPWVVVSKGPRRLQSFMKPSTSNEFNPATLRRSANGLRGTGNAISRDVDAVIDVERPLQGDEDADDLTPLLQRTLRKRGLSDSSIRSTFASHAEETKLQRPSVLDASMWSGSSSVFQTLSMTVQTLRNTAVTPSAPGPIDLETPVIASEPQDERLRSQAVPEIQATRTPGLRHLLPNLSSWAAASEGALEPSSHPFLMGSVRDDAFMPPRAPRPGDSHGHEYF
ncbi:hypothetical protein DXG03_000050 [Asterophora parasitica]|uniref:Uncharacterized protein n=1 Tax=Asterophora parasitica TaxID=117018 RepID=A0A9P7KFM2_9AGAR|nr:hypothetical protein DXG03_000050 [Asterophora parasitica]